MGKGRKLKLSGKSISFLLKNEEEVEMINRLKKFCVNNNISLKDFLIEVYRNYALQLDEKGEIL